MKKYVLIITAVLLFNTIYSQEYHPLVEENKTWYVIGGQGWYDGTTIYKCEGDTIIGDITYKFLFSSIEEFPVNWDSRGLLREDEDHKVYFTDNYGNDTINFNPRLLYDFGAEVGDTLNVFPGIFTDDSLEIIIYQIDSVLVDGEYRKKTWFNCEMNIGWWIEGIGSNTGLLEVGFYCLIICPTLELGCVKKDEITIYPDGHTGNCFLVGIDELTEEKQLFDIFPNPASGYLVVSPKTNSQSNLLFELYNNIGMKVSQIELMNNFPTRINVKEFENGLYLYSITNENIVVQNGQIMIQ